MKGFKSNIEKNHFEKQDFRHVLYTGKYSQLVLMTLKPGEEIGEEVHKTSIILQVRRRCRLSLIDGVSRRSLMEMPS